MRVIDPAFQAKIIPETHISLGALTEEINAKVDLRSARLHWNAKVELDREKSQSRPKTLCNSGRDPG